MTVLQKYNYARLYADMLGKDVNQPNFNDYINADVLRNSINDIQNEKERTIICMYYGLDDGNPVSKNEIADKLGVSRQYLNAYLTKARKRLRRKRKDICTNVDDKNQIEERLAEIEKEDREISNIEEKFLLDPSTCGEASDEEIKKLRNYYSNLFSRLGEKDKLRAALEYNNDIRDLKNFYFNEEDIFNPQAIVPKTSIKSIESRTHYIGKSIADIDLPLQSLIPLHHSGIETLDDLKGNTTNVRELKDKLEKIEGLDDTRIREIIMQVTGANEKMPIAELDLSVRSYNALVRAGIYTVRDLVELGRRFREVENFRETLKRIRYLGEISAEEIIKALEDIGVIELNTENKPVFAGTYVNNTLMQFRNPEYMQGYEEIMFPNEKESDEIPIGLIPIEEWELSIRAYNCLHRAGIHNVEELLGIIYSRGENFRTHLQVIRNMGKVTADEVIQKLISIGALEELEDGKLVDSTKQGVLKRIQAHQAELAELRRTAEERGIDLNFMGTDDSGDGLDLLNK